MGHFKADCLLHVVANKTNAPQHCGKHCAVHEMLAQLYSLTSEDETMVPAQILWTTIPPQTTQLHLWGLRIQ
eukprot:3449492-Amphidinium_carterae.6